MKDAKTCTLSISTKDGRILLEEQLTALRVKLDKIPKEKEFVEIDLQLVVNRKEAETIYNSLSTGVVHIEVHQAIPS